MLSNLEKIKAQFLIFIQKFEISLLETRNIQNGIQYKLKKNSDLATFNIYRGKSGVSFVIQASQESDLKKQINEHFIIKFKEIPEINNGYIGTDEVGKGDYFGGLVICGVLVTKQNIKSLINLNVKDSKTLSDDKCIELARKIKIITQNSIVYISAEKYNALYSKFNNLNSLLSWGHARVIENLLEKNKCDKVIVDKFCSEEEFKKALLKNGRKIKIELREHAESDIAVASASIIARAYFLTKLHELSKLFGLNLPKGAGDPVLNAAKIIVKNKGVEFLNKIAKVHFRTTKLIDKNS
jgi:ribonuclease HIII